MHKFYILLCLIIHQVLKDLNHDKEENCYFNSMTKIQLLQQPQMGNKQIINTVVRNKEITQQH